MMPPLLSQLTRAKNGLEDAQIALCGAVVAHAGARDILEWAEAHLIHEGVEGNNEKKRAARLRHVLATGYHELLKAENALTEARCACEVARLEWDLVRYQLRVHELYREVA